MENAEIVISTAPVLTPAQPKTESLQDCGSLAMKYLKDYWWAIVLLLIIGYFIIKQQKTEKSKEKESNTKPKKD